MSNPRAGEVMFQRNHLGALRETVKLTFTNGYSLTLQAGVIMSLSITMAIDPNDPKVALHEFVEDEK